MPKISSNKLAAGLLFIFGSSETNYKVIFMLTHNGSIWCSAKSSAKSISSRSEMRDKRKHGKENTTRSNPPPPALHASRRARNQTGIRAGYCPTLTVNRSHGLASHQSQCLVYSRIFLFQQPKPEPESGFTKKTFSLPAQVICTEITSLCVIYQELKVLQLVLHCS